MTKPLALLYYIHLLPGSQLANRLHELGYRVLVVNDLRDLDKVVEQEKPILMLAEIGDKTQGEVCAAIAALKANSATQHLPVLTFAKDPDKALQNAIVKAGASLLANSVGILDQLPSLLDYILQVE